MKPGQFIDYEALAQDAMRGIVRAVLAEVVKSGLFGDHHFYIAFSTVAPGVSLSKRLREKYPLEMTIVLQHRFWDLEVGEEGFEVKLTFDSIPERLAIPFKAIKVFYDPSVPYGLQFESADRAAEDLTTTTISGVDGVLPTPFGASTPDRTQSRLDPNAPERRPRRSKPERVDKHKSEAGEVKPAPVTAPPDAMPVPPDGDAASARVEASERGRAGRPVLSEIKGDAAAEPDASNDKVVDLSKFRKK